MNRLFRISMYLVLLCGVFWVGAFNSHATDVWVARNSDGIDIYVMDDTIKYGTNKGSKWFSVSTKKVRDGRLLGVTNVRYSKYKSDMWRYYIKTQQAGRYAVLTPTSPVFEYVMKELRWYYEARSVYTSTYYY